MMVVLFQIVTSTRCVITAQFLRFVLLAPRIPKALANVHKTAQFGRTKVPLDCYEVRVNRYATAIQ